MIFTEGASSRGYFDNIDRFLVDALGEQVRQYYQIIRDDPVAVATAVKTGVERVTANRRAGRDAYYFNWLLHIPREMKEHFIVTHASMAALDIHAELPPDRLAINLRRAFSGIVAGNVKDSGVRMIREHGPFELHGDPQVLEAVDQLLRSFVEQGRMKLGDRPYDPCYRIVAPAILD